MAPTMLEELCKRIQHCCATLRRSRQQATTSNNIQRGVQTDATLFKALRRFRRAQGSNPAKREFFRPPFCNCISCFFNCGDLFCIHFLTPQLQCYKIHILIISMYKLLLKEFLRGPLGFMPGSLFDLVLHVYAS